MLSHTWVYLEVGCTVLAHINKWESHFWPTSHWLCTTHWRTNIPPCICITLASQCMYTLHLSTNISPYIIPDDQHPILHHTWWLCFSPCVYGTVTSYPMCTSHLVTSIPFYITLNDFTYSLCAQHNYILPDVYITFGNQHSILHDTWWLYISVPVCTAQLHPTPCVHHT